MLRKSDNDTVLVVSGGVTLYECLNAAKKLEGEINVRVIDLFSVNPVDKDELNRSLEQCGNRIMVVEDHFEHGGLGDSVRRAICGKQCTFVHKFVDKLPFSAKPNTLYKLFKFDADSIATSLRELAGK